MSYPSQERAADLSEVGRLRSEVEKLKFDTIVSAAQLRAAIIEHRAQKADDRCVEVVRLRCVEAVVVLDTSWWVDEWAPDGSYVRRVWYRAAKVQCDCGWRGKGPAFEKGQPEPALPDKCPKCGKV